MTPRERAEALAEDIVPTILAARPGDTIIEGRGEPQQSFHAWASAKIEAAILAAERAAFERADDELAGLQDEWNTAGWDAAIDEARRKIRALASSGDGKEG